MKRKLTFCTLVLTSLLLVGCTSKNIQGTEHPSTPESAQASPSSTVTPSAEPSQSHDGQNQGAQNQDVENPAAHTQDTQNSGAQSQDSAPREITEEMAREIALTHVGLDANQVTFIKSGIDTDNGKKYYDVEFFTTDPKEYDYEIDLYTGEILDYDYDAEYYPQSSETTTGERIAENDARQIALSQVPGATEQDVREFHSDYDNGKHIYEGKIFYGQTEYEFEIDGSTGTILEWDAESIYCDVP